MVSLEGGGFEGSSLCVSHQGAPATCGILGGPGFTSCSANIEGGTLLTGNNIVMNTVSAVYSLSARWPVQRFLCIIQLIVYMVSVVILRRRKVSLVR